MSEFSHCLYCGRKLRDGFFCARCGQCLCSIQCLDQHAAQGCKRASNPGKASAKILDMSELSWVAREQPPEHS